MFCVLELWNPMDITVCFLCIFFRIICLGIQCQALFTGSAQLPVCFKNLNKVGSLCPRRKAGIVLSVNMSMKPAHTLMRNIIVVVTESFTDR